MTGSDGILQMNADGSPDSGCSAVHPAVWYPFYRRESFPQPLQKRWTIWESVYEAVITVLLWHTVPSAVRTPERYGSVSGTPILQRRLSVFWRHWTVCAVPGDKLCTICKHPVSILTTASIYCIIFQNKYYRVERNASYG